MDPHPDREGGERRDDALRVEQALRLLPELDALAPLRAFVIGASEVDPENLWASSATYRTVGKRRVHAEELRRRLGQLLQPILEHLSALYEAVLEALEHQERGHTAAAVSALVRAGEREQRVGRWAAAAAFYERALELSEGLRDRRPEMEALRRLGEVSAAVGDFTRAGRFYQRSLTLAEAELKTEEAILACEGLGDLALAQSAWGGAEAWYRRGVALAEELSEPALRLRLLHCRALVALGRGDAAAAQSILELAQPWVKSAADPWARVRDLEIRARLAAHTGDHEAARAGYEEALGAIRERGGDPRREAALRLERIELHLDRQAHLAAEEEARRVEEVAIESNLMDLLVQAYVRLGRLSGQRNEDSGFIFFETALELCRRSSMPARVEGEVNLEYALFRARFGEREEARARLDRAVSLLEPIGSTPALERARQELETLLEVVS